MALANLDFCNGTSGNVAAIQLKLCRQHVLCHPFGFPNFANVASDLFFNYSIHTHQPLHLYWNNCLGIILPEGYRYCAPQ